MEVDGRSQIPTYLIADSVCIRAASGQGWQHMNRARNYGRLTFIFGITWKISDAVRLKVYMRCNIRDTTNEALSPILKERFLGDKHDFR